MSKALFADKKGLLMKTKLLIICSAVTAIVIVFALSAGIAGYTAISYLSDAFYLPGSELTVVQSPDGDRKLIIAEWGGPGCTVIEVFYFDEGVSLFKTNIADTDADEMCFPFKDGKYIAEWEDDEVKLRYWQGRPSHTDDPETWACGTYKLPDHSYQRWGIVGTIVALLLVIATPVVLICLGIRRKRRVRE